MSFETVIDYDKRSLSITFNYQDCSFDIGQPTLVPESKHNTIIIDYDEDYKATKIKHYNDFGIELENPTIDDVIKYTEENFYGSKEDKKSLLEVLEEMKG